jgi:hypothetical protein
MYTLEREHEEFISPHLFSLNSCNFDMYHNYH